MVVVPFGGSLSIWKEFDLCDKEAPPGSCDPDEVEFSDQNGCSLRFSTASFKPRQITKEDFVDGDGNCHGIRSSNWTALVRVKLGKANKKKMSLKIATAESKDRSALLLNI